MVTILEDLPERITNPMGSELGAKRGLFGVYLAAMVTGRLQGIGEPL
jgi:hypothetical protein